MRRGYLTVFFACIMTLCLSFILVLIYGVRESAIRVKIVDSAQVSIKAIFAEYSRPLWDKFGLLFVDCGYGTRNSSPILMEERLQKFVNNNFAETSLLTMEGYDLLKLHANGVQTEVIRLASDNAGKAIKEQTAKVMEQRLGVPFLEELCCNLDIQRDLLEKVPDLGSLKEKELNHLDPRSAAITNKWVQALPISKKQQETYLESDGILKLVLDSTEDISTQTIDGQVFADQRELNVGNQILKEGNSLYEDICFIEYILNTLGNYWQKKDESVLQYQVEYVLCGKKADKENLKSTVNQLLLIREGLNAVSLYQDTSKMDIIRAVSELTSGILTVPEAEPAFEIVIIAGWAYLESISDVRTLLSGGKIPLIKEGYEWMTQIEMVTESDDSSEVNRECVGLNYLEYVRILLYLSNKDDTMRRFMAITEMDVRKAEGNDNFRIDNCFDQLEVSMFVTSGYGYEFMVQQNNNY